MSRIFKALERAEAGRRLQTDGQAPATPPSAPERQPAREPEPQPEPRVERQVPRAPERQPERPVIAPPAPPIIRASAVLEPAQDEEEIELPQAREEMERLKIMLSLAASRSELRTVMFVSALAGEGVSSVSLGLASELAAGAMQGVLLVESSSGHASLGEWLQISPRYGLSDMLAKAIQRNEAVLSTGVPRLFYLSRGRVDADFSQPRWTGLFEELIADLRDAFDYVVLDGGSLETSPDSLLLARRVDGVVLVVESETSASLVREATMNLRKAGANLLGVVLNRRRRYLPKFLAKRM